MTRPVEFTEYNGWTNYATWATFTHIDDNEARRWTNILSADIGQLQESFSAHMEQFFRSSQRDRFREMLMQDWITCAIQWIDWPGVLYMLRGKEPLQEPTNLDMVAVTYFTSVSGPWETIASSAKGGEDQALKDWTIDSVITRIEFPAVRAHETSPASLFIKSCFDIVIGSIDWNSLTEALKEQ